MCEAPLALRGRMASGGQHTFRGRLHRVGPGRRFNNEVSIMKKYYIVGITNPDSYREVKSSIFQ